MSSTREEWRSWLDQGARDIVFRAVCNTLRRGGTPLPQAVVLSDDATQEAIRRFLTADPKPTTESLSDFVAYLRTAALRTIWADLRRPAFSGTVDRLSARVPDSVLPSKEISDALDAALREDMSPEDRKILALKYDLGETDCEIAAKVLPPDTRSASARAQDLRRRRLQALERLRLHLRRRGIADFPLDLDTYTPYTFGS